MFLILITYKVSIEEVDKHIESHRAFLQRYFDSGQFIFAGRKNPRNGGLIVAHGNDRAAIERIVAEDSFAQHQVAEFEIIEFTPTMYNDLFAPIAKT